MDDQVKRLAEVFAVGGLMDQAGFQRREPQLQMVREIMRTIKRAEEGDKAAVVVEALCGTGKSIAYLVPAIEHAVRTNGRVVVATANIALQEQLMKVDLPRLAELLPWEFRYTQLKGMSQYLCLRNFTQWFGGNESQITKMQMAKWAEATTTGDRSDLDFFVSDAAWAKLSTASDDCDSTACSYQLNCWAYRARKNIASAHVIVVNYHLLFASWMMSTMNESETEEAGLVPVSSVLVCDEAHSLTEIARQFRTVEFSSRTLHNIRTRAMRWLSIEIVDSYMQAANEVIETIRQYIDGTQENPERATVTFPAAPPFPLAKLKAATNILKIALIEEMNHHSSGSVEKIRISNLLLLLEGAISRFTRMEQGSNDKQVVWVETKPDEKLGWYPILKVCPINVSDWLSKHLYRENRATVMCSATLTVAEKPLQPETHFDFFLREVGLPEQGSIRRVALPSPFDLKAAGRLFVPPEELDVKPSTQILRAIQATHGGVLVLFTSNSAMAKAEKDLRPKLEAMDRKLLVQGEGSRTALADMFRSDVRSILFGTRSFFAGIDVPGDALQLVIIDKLPFPVPTDPIVVAIQRNYEANGASGFYKHSLPLTALTCAQAAGRLIRTPTDRGVVMLLDQRVVDKSYGAVILKSLPPFPLIRSWEQFEAFMGQLD